MEGKVQPLTVKDVVPIGELLQVASSDRRPVWLVLSV